MGVMSKLRKLSVGPDEVGAYETVFDPSTHTLLLWRLTDVQI